jgi:hypothetical protein
MLILCTVCQIDSWYLSPFKVHLVAIFKLMNPMRLVWGPSTWNISLETWASRSSGCSMAMRGSGVANMRWCPQRSQLRFLHHGQCRRLAGSPRAACCSRSRWKHWCLVHGNGPLPRSMGRSRATSGRRLWYQCKLCHLGRLSRNQPLRTLVSFQTQSQSRPNGC